MVNKIVHSNIYNFLWFIDEDVQEFGAIEENKPTSEIRQDPYSLPDGFVWDTLDIGNPGVVGFL